MYRVKQLDKVYQQSSQKKKGDVMVRAILTIRSIGDKKTVVKFLKEKEKTENVFESRVKKEFPDVYNKDVNFYGVLKKYADKDLDKYFVRFSNS